jgi:hypothetical protein
MAIVRVRQLEGRDERLVTCDQAIGHRIVDQALQAGGLLLCDVWVPLPDRPRHLIQDLLGPLRLNQVALLANPEKQIPLGVAEQCVGIVDDNVGHLSTAPAPR